MTHSHKLNAIALLLLSTATIAVAAPPVIPNLPRDTGLPSGLLMRENKQTPELPKKQSEADIENKVEQRPPMQADNSLKLTVQYFALHGNSEFSSVELQSLLNKYKNHPIGFNDLQSAANDITEFYRKAGYIIAYAYIPAQKIKNNIVEIEVLELSLIHI
mgnify:CR=1 FL=1